MERIDIFYQGEGLVEIQHLAAEPDETIGAVKARLCKQHGMGPDAAVFLEDHEEPLDDAASVRKLAGAAGLKIHVHRCRRVEVTVTFNCETVERRFPPSATVARVKYWAAVREFGLSEDEAGEHVLQLSGTQERPLPGTHIGALVACPDCRVAFDLVPDERINGFPRAIA